MKEDGTRVVENDGIGLALGGSQHSADHLAEQPHLFRWSCENAATHIGHVPSLGEHHAGDEHLRLAPGPTRSRLAALGLRRRTVDMFGADAGADELVTEMD